MRDKKDYIQDINEIRSMMERTSKFLSLAGWAGIMAGFYALIGAFTAYYFLGLTPEVLANRVSPAGTDWLQLVLTGLVVLALAVGTAVYFSSEKASRRGERLWNSTSRRLLLQMSVPLVAGGLLVLILLSQGYVGLAAPLTLVFYGLALYNAGNFTYPEIRFLGILQIALGLLSTCFVPLGLFFWATGFGVLHIVYGIYIHYKYER